MHFEKIENFKERLQCNHEEKLECLETLNAIINIMILHYHYKFSYREDTALPVCITHKNLDNGAVLPEKVFDLLIKGLQMVSENTDPEFIIEEMIAEINKRDLYGGAFLKSILITEGILAIRKKKSVDELIDKSATYFDEAFIEKYYQFFADCREKEKKELFDFFTRIKDKPCKTKQTNILDDAVENSSIYTDLFEKYKIDVLAKALLGASGNLQLRIFIDLRFSKAKYTCSERLKERKRYLLFKEMEALKNTSAEEIAQFQKILLKICLKEKKDYLRKEKKEEARCRGNTSYNVDLLKDCTEQEKKDCIETVFSISKLIVIIRTFGFLVVKDTKAIKMPGLLDVGRKMFYDKKMYTFLNHYIKKFCYLSYDLLEAMVIKEGLLALTYKPLIEKFEDAILPYFGSEYKELFKSRWELEENRLQGYLKNIANRKPLSPKTSLLEKELLNTESTYIVKGMDYFDYENTAKALQGLSAEAVTRAFNSITDKDPENIYCRGKKFLLFDEIKALNKVGKKETEEMQEGLLNAINQTK